MCWESFGRRKWCRLAATAVVVSGLTGCNPAGEHDAPAVRDWAGTADTIEGVVVVENPPEPIVENASAAVTERWRSDVEDRLSDRESWEDAPDVSVGPTGEVFVLDYQARRVLAFDSDSGTGEYAFRSGPGGEDEEDGELARPLGMAVVDDAVMVGKRQGVDVFGHDGAFRRRIDIPTENALLDRGVRLHELDSGSAAMLQLRGGAPIWRRIRPSGEVSRYPKPEAVSRQYSEATRRRCWRVGRGASGLFLGSCFFPVILEVDSARGIVREAVIESGADSASEAELERLREESRAHWSTSEESLPSDAIEARVQRDVQLHRIKDKYREVRYDPVTGLVSVLEETPEYLGGGSATLQLFNGEGRYWARIDFPEYWISHDMRNSVVYALVRGPDGRRSLRAYALDAPVVGGAAAGGPGGGMEDGESSTVEEGSAGLRD